MSGLAAAMKAGSAFGPWGAALGGAAGLASDVAGAASGPITSGSSLNQAGLQNGVYDGSNWAVNFSGTQKLTQKRDGQQGSNPRTNDTAALSKPPTQKGYPTWGGSGSGDPALSTAWDARPIDYSEPAPQMLGMNPNTLAMLGLGAIIVLKMMA